MAQMTRLAPFAALLVVLAAAGCTRNRPVDTDLKIVDVRTGWYDAGIVNGSQNKLVPSVSLKLQNVSAEEIARVQLNAIFRRVGEPEGWGEHLVRAIGPDGLDAGATSNAVVLRSTLGYTGDESRIEMLNHKDFVDARVEIFGKHGSATWVKMGEYQIDRQLLTQ